LTRVALVNPRDSCIPIQDYAVYENLGLALLGASLRQRGYEVKIIDGYAECLSNEEVARRVAAFRPSVVGFTCTFQSYHDTQVISERLRDLLPGAHLTLGGEHATYAADSILSSSTAFDSIVRGEGEVTLCELVRAVESGFDLGTVEGLYRRSGDGVVKNRERRSIEDLDSLPFAARDTLARCAESGRPVLIGMLGSRGCAYRCSFCNANGFFRLGGGNSVRRRSPANIVAEVSQIYRDYARDLLRRGVDVELYFYDATFITKGPRSKQWAREIAEGLISEGVSIPFKAFVRADSFSQADDRLIDLLKRAGLVGVFVGFESATDEVLASFDKGASADQNREAYELLKRHSILETTNGFIMFGPYSTLEGLRENASFLLRTRQASYWNLSQRLQLFPGVRLLAKLEKDGLLLSQQDPCGVYSYRFRDPLVGMLAEALDWNNDPTVQHENSLVRYVKNTINYINRSCYNKNIYESTNINTARTRLETRFKKIGNLNHRIFNLFLDIALGGWSGRMFEKVRRTYLRSLEGELEELTVDFRTFLETFQSVNLEASQRP